MAYRKKTLRQMSPTTRKLARLQGEMASITRRFKNALEEVKRIEKKASLLDEEGKAVMDRLTENEQEA